jgi:Flp pilus assembly protein TadG
LRPLAHIRRTSAGQALVEFTLVAPVLFLMLFGVIEGGRLVWTNHEVVNGTREGARLAMVSGSQATNPATEGDIANLIINRTAGLNLGDLTVQVTGLGGEPGTKAVVTATYQYRPIVGMVFGVGTIELNARSEVTIQH